MKYTAFGSTGINCSRLIYGTWYMPHEDKPNGEGVYPVSVKKSKELISKAIEVGINTFDTADVYRGVYNRGRKVPDYSDVGHAEEILGEAFKEYDRESLVIVTKVTGKTGPLPNDEGHSRKHVRKAISDSLKRLKTDYTDIYLLHSEDTRTPLDKSIRTMNNLIDEGQILHYGVSNFRAEQIEAMFGICREQGLEPPSVIQDVYNLINRNFESGNKKISEKYGLASMIYSPLAQGVLAGRYSKEDTSVSRQSYDGLFAARAPGLIASDVVKKVSEMGKSKSASMAKISLAWLISQGKNIFPIIGASKVEQLLDSADAVDLELGSKDIEALSAL